jgi:hypothetical protein
MEEEAAALEEEEGLRKRRRTREHGARLPLDGLPARLSAYCAVALLLLPSVRVIFLALR